MQNHNGVTPSIDTRPGAVRFMFTERTMKMYCIHESELKNLSLMDTWATILFAFGSFSLGIIASIFTNWAIQEPTSGLSKMSLVLIIMSAIVSFISYLFALWMVLSKKSQLKEIGKTSKIVSDSLQSVKQ